MRVTKKRYPLFPRQCSVATLPVVLPSAFMLNLLLHFWKEQAMQRVAIRADPGYFNFDAKAKYLTSQRINIR